MYLENIFDTEKNNIKNIFPARSPPASHPTFTILLPGFAPMQSGQKLGKCHAKNIKE
jgi:hypothetical protein